MITTLDSTQQLLQQEKKTSSLAAKEKENHLLMLIQRRSETRSHQHSKKKIPCFLGFILCLCLLLHGPASWLSSFEFKNRVWEKISIDAKSAQNLVLQPTELQQTKINLDYDVASGSSVYCNGDPVNGLDPDGRCVEKLNNAEVNVSYSWNQADNQSDADIGVRILAGIPVSILSGDAFTHYTTPEEQMSDYGFMPSAFSANGVFASDDNIAYMRTKVAERLSLEENNVFRIQNPSYGPLDLIRAGGQQAGAIDITALRAADMINASGGGTFVAHSNGSALFYAASPLLRPEVKANLIYKGYGPQINVNTSNDPGLRSYYNDAGSNDWIARGLNPNAHWDRIIPQSLFHPYDNHMFKQTYAPELY